MKQNIIDFLLLNADFSIKLRIKKEILKNISQKEEEEYFEKILIQKNVQDVITSQKPDGWFGNNFHGQSPKFGAGMYNNMEVGLRFLVEKGFSSENVYISKAINSFLINKPFDKILYGIKEPENPEMDYKYTASGLYLPRSSIIIRAGYENILQKNDFINLKHDINFSLKTFLNVLNYKSLKDVIDTNRKKLCFKPDILWPCMYHLRMLAHSKGWRNNKNINLLAESLNHLFNFHHSKEMVYTYIKGQFVGPCFAFINMQMHILEILEKNGINLDTLELFARCGAIKKVELLKKQYKYLISLVKDNLKINLSKKPDKGWSPYFGFSLEEDWKNNIKYQCDILFRILLIIHYTNE